MGLGEVLMAKGKPSDYYTPVRFHRKFGGWGFLSIPIHTGEGQRGWFSSTKAGAVKRRKKVIARYWGKK